MLVILLKARKVKILMHLFKKHERYKIIFEVAFNSRNRGKKSKHFMIQQRTNKDKTFFIITLYLCLMFFTLMTIYSYYIAIKAILFNKIEFFPLNS